MLLNDIFERHAIHLHDLVEAIDQRIAGSRLPLVGYSCKAEVIAGSNGRRSGNFSASCSDAVAWPLNSEAVQTSSRPKAVSQSAKLIPLAFFAAINAAVTVSCEGAARDGGLGAGKQSLLDSRNRHCFKNNIPPRNVKATVKLSGSATKRNAAIATKMKMEFGCIKHINSPANCSTLKFVA